MAKESEKIKEQSLASQEKISGEMSAAASDNAHAFPEFELTDDPVVTAGAGEDSRDSPDRAKKGKKKSTKEDEEWWLDRGYANNSQYRHVSNIPGTNLPAFERARNKFGRRKKLLVMSDDPKVARHLIANAVEQGKGIKLSGSRKSLIAAMLYAQALEKGVPLLGDYVPDKDVLQAARAKLGILVPQPQQEPPSPTQKSSSIQASFTNGASPTAQVHKFNDFPKELLGKELLVGFSNTGEVLLRDPDTKKRYECTDKNLKERLGLKQNSMNGVESLKVTEEAGEYKVEKSPRQQNHGQGQSRGTKY
ncbi:MAG: hypothetical protein V4568_09335 [Pseudomonadota bacterium]